MAQEEKAAKQGLGAKFMHWYGSYQGKNIVNMVYSVGASVVIVGALFKILHWPGASYVLMLGMFTEAFLFIIGVFEHPHPEFHWENVFPQLLGYGTREDILEEYSTHKAPTLLGAGYTVGQQAVEGNAQGAAGNEKKVNAPVLSEKDMDALKDGIAGLAKTAVQLQELGKIATSTNKLGEKMDAAAGAADQFAQAATKLADNNAELSNAYVQVTKDMQGAVSGAQAYNKQVADLGAKVGQLSAVYELQLNAIQAQTAAYQAQTEQINRASEQYTAVQTDVTAQYKTMQNDVAMMVKNANAAMKNTAAYEEATKQLASQVADLNKIYGNMLGALA